MSRDKTLEFWFSQISDLLKTELKSKESDLLI